MSFDMDRVRASFPALAIGDRGQERIYLDNPAGTQIVQGAIDRMTDYLVRDNANCGGMFQTSKRTDSLLDTAHQAAADFLHAESPEEVVFGPNMTSLTFSISRALGTQIEAGDEIVLSRLDHDANVRPWILMARDRGAHVRWIDFDPQDCRLKIEALPELLNERTRLVAVGLASNLVGTINPVAQIAEQVHRVGAQLFVDAVHYAPHGVIDVAALGADFLVCSPYKFFGPHQGILWGKRSLLEALPAYRVEPAGEALPGKFETGTQSHEGQAGVLGAIEYLAWLGREFGEPGDGRISQRAAIRYGMRAINRYERLLTRELINELQAIERVKIWGITDPNELEHRVPTVSFTVDGVSPRWIAEMFAAENIFTWHGHSYAVEVVRRLGLAESGGVLRIGAVHYNTPSELSCMAEVLRRALHRN